MSDNPIANIFARLVGERSDVAARAFERSTFGYAMERGCDLGREASRTLRRREVTRFMRDGSPGDWYFADALDALWNAIQTSQARAEELRRRAMEAMSTSPAVVFPSSYDSAEVFVDGRRVDADGVAVERGE